MKINLVQNGIFPILYDKDNQLLENVKLDTNFQIPGTIQGEGKLSGIPCLFIRTTGCNLRCAWLGSNGKGNICDTPYSSYDAETNNMEIDDVVATIKANQGNIKHIVVSGGEPTMKPRQLSRLLEGLRNLGLHTTIESNGTIYNEQISKHTNLFSFSPKLSNSIPTKDKFKHLDLKYDPKWEKLHNKRIKIPVLQKYIDDCYLGDDYKNRNKYKDFQLKFVVNSEEDINEIQETFLNNLKGVRPEDVQLMPEGITPEEINEKSIWIVNKCVEKGWRFTTRLHTLLFGTLRGV